MYLVKILHSSETEYCSPRNTEDLEKGDLVVVETRYGRDLGRILGTASSFSEKADDNDPEGDERLDSASDIYPILRKASDVDVKKFEENAAREAEALEICRDKVQRHNLDMKLVSAHYVLEESKVLFFFTADARVDFRELVKDLVSVFKMRIELRQIGVRDESRVVGGVGVCGRAFCCHGLTDKLRPVSIKMAKVQNLSLNSMKISGPCGRLLCCLAYEYDTYFDEKRRLPPEGYRLTYDNTLFRIQEVNILSKMIRLFGDDGRLLEIPFSRIKKRDSGNHWEIIALDG